MPTWQWSISQGGWDAKTNQQAIHIRIEADVPASGTDIKKLQALLTRIVAVIDDA